MPAHNLKIENGKVTIYKYWNYPSKTYKVVNYEEAVSRYGEIFTEAVKLRMRSDVAIGTTLSSGIDSGSIVSVIRKNFTQDHNSFTAVFNAKDYKKSDKGVFASNIIIDEAILVKRLANDLNLNAHLIKIPNSNFIKDLERVLHHLESGHSSPATIPLFNVMDYAKKHVTVVLEGQGADELLGGYIVNNFLTVLFENIKKFEFKFAYNEYNTFKKHYSISYAVKQFIRNRNWNIIERFYSYYTGREMVFGDKLIKYSRITDYPNAPKGFNNRLNSELYKSHTGGLVNLLHYGDAISMANSLESRLPFMDFNLVEYVFQLPTKFKVKNGYGKYIHRSAMEGLLPDYILKNPIKFGFNIPLSQQFEKIDSDAIQILLSERCLNRGIYSKRGLTKLINEHTHSKANHSTFLFRLLSTELWFRQFIDN